MKMRDADVEGREEGGTEVEGMRVGGRKRKREDKESG